MNTVLTEFRRIVWPSLCARVEPCCWEVSSDSFSHRASLTELLLHDRDIVWAKDLKLSTSFLWCHYTSFWALRQLRSKVFAAMLNIEVSKQITGPGRYQEQDQHDAEVRNELVMENLGLSKNIPSTHGWSYPLGMTEIAAENHYFEWEHPLFLWWFSIVMWNYRRVFPMKIAQQVFWGYTSFQSNPSLHIPDIFH